MKLITREWLNRASDDLGVIEEIIDNENLTNMSAFHAQQAVEKTLKALVEEYEIGFVKTHKLEFLLEKVKGYIPFAIDRTSIKRLDEVYTETRYPAELGLLPYGKPSGKEVRRLQEFAMTLFEDVTALLNTL
jgi:HEPN domain-containing protein